MMEENEKLVLFAIFSKFTLRNNCISRTDFPKLLKALRIETSQPNRLFNKIDIEGNGWISFENLWIWWKTQPELEAVLKMDEKLILIEKAYQAYNLYTNDSTMTLAQFSEMLNDMNIPFTYDQLIKIDRDRDGAINFAEFLSWLKWF